MKPYVKVTLTLHGGTEKVITDYVDNSGRFIAIGTQAAAMLDRHKAIHYVDANGVETIIPYHAIVAVNITKESDDYTKPEDAFCVSEGGKTYDVYFSYLIVDGETGDCGAPLLEIKSVAEGEVPVYTGTMPTIPDSEFEGWYDEEAWHDLGCQYSPNPSSGHFYPKDTPLPIVTGDAYYYAIYD